MPPLSLELHAPSDFDFIMGDWVVLHRRLNLRLVHCQEWTTFKGESSTTKILGGYGNLEDNLLHFPEGAVRAVAMRSYDRDTHTWSIWWLDVRNPNALDTPVRGRFNDGVGTFYADDVLDGKPIRVRFIWTPGHENRPQWEQAFSPDSGATWETNWTMTFTPATAPT